MFLAILRRERRRLVESATGSACLNAVCGYFIGCFFFFYYLEQIRDKSVRLAIFYNTYLLIFFFFHSVSLRKLQSCTPTKGCHTCFSWSHSTEYGGGGGKFFDLKKNAVFNTECALTVPARHRAEIGKCLSKRKFGEASQKAHLVAVLGPYKQRRAMQRVPELFVVVDG